MKRLRPKVQARLIKASARELEKRRTRRHDGEIYGDEVRSQNRALPASLGESFRTDSQTVELGGPLELVSRSKPSLAQLLELEQTNFRPKRQTRLQVLLTEVTSLDAPALVFLASRIRNLGRVPFLRVAGTWPTATKPLTMMRDAGFQNFIKGRLPGLSNARCVELVQGTEQQHKTVHPQTADRIQAFLSSRHQGLERDEVDTIGVAVREALENVRIHAYRKRAEWLGWYAVGWYDDEERTSSVAILDLGVGIRETVIATVPSKFQKLLKSNADYVEEAILGVRTHTGERHRGQGFRWLREFVMEKENRRLHVLSSGAMVTWGQFGPISKSATPSFPGTIVCLQISNA